MVACLFLSKYLGHLHSDLGSNTGGVEADEGVSAITLLERFGMSTTQKGGLRCVHWRGMPCLDVGMSDRRTVKLEFSLNKEQYRCNWHESETI